MLETAKEFDPESTIEEVEYEDIKDDEYPEVAEGFPEAGGIAYADIYIGNFGVSITERRTTGMAALQALASTLKYAKERYNATGRPPTAPAHTTAYAPVQESFDENIVPVLKVKKILGTKEGKMKGKPMIILTVSGLADTDSVLCFPNNLPQNVQDSLGMWEVGKEFEPPVELNYAIVKPAGEGRYNVVRFQSEL